MATFKVIVTSDLTESCVLHVEADDRIAANDLALDMAREDQSLKWETDDCNPRRPYIGDVDGAELIDYDYCQACGRFSGDCSRDPCPAVIADREA